MYVLPPKYSTVQYSTVQYSIHTQSYGCILHMDKHTLPFYQTLNCIVYSRTGGNSKGNIKIKIAQKKIVCY